MLNATSLIREVAVLSNQMDHGGGPPHRRRSWIRRQIDRLGRRAEELGLPRGNPRQDPRWRCEAPAGSEDAEGVRGPNTVAEVRKSRRRTIGAAERGGWGHRWMFVLLRRYRRAAAAAAVAAGLALLLPGTAGKLGRSAPPPNLVMLVDPSPAHSRAGLVPDLDQPGADLVARNGIELADHGGVVIRGPALSTAAVADGSLLPVYPLVRPSGTAAALLGNAGAQRRAVNELTALAVRNRYGGLNLDFGPIPADLAGAFRSLVSLLAADLHRVGRALQVTVSPDEVDRLAQLAGEADLVVLAAHRPQLFSLAPEPIAPLEWVDSLVQQALTAVPADRLVLGLAAYGRRWSDGAGPVERLSLADIDQIRQDTGTRPAVTRDGAYLRYREGGATYQVWYEDGRTAAEKARLARRYGLRGVAVWRPGPDRGDYWAPVLSAIKGAP